MAAGDPHPFYWRTAPTGTEGVDTVYVHSIYGSDVCGDGTRQKPYESLGKAYRYHEVKPKYIICVGRFCENIADGDHGGATSLYIREIKGDYWGAATFDGADTYIIYGFAHSNMFIEHMPIPTGELTVYSGSPLVAGCGRARSAGIVGNVINANGVAGSTVMINDCTVYMGAIGGIATGSYIIYNNLKCHPDHKIYLMSRSQGTVISHLTVHGCRIGNRRLLATIYTGTFKQCIFSDFDMFANDQLITFDNCVFDVDCRWYYGEDEIVLSGATSASRYQSLLDGMDALQVPAAERATFVNCVFSLQDDEGLFNNPGACDFTLKLDSDGVFLDEYNEQEYRGALGPAINVPIYADSDGHPACWDNNTCSGFLEVTSEPALVANDIINKNAGQIFSKVVKVNVENMRIESLFAHYVHNDFFTIRVLDTSTMAEMLEAGDILPRGVFFVYDGGITYNHNDYNTGDNFFVDTDNTTFLNRNNYPAYVHQVHRPTLFDCVYVRSTPAIYARVKQSDTLSPGTVYLNMGPDNVSYNGRTIVPNESFVAVSGTDTFVHADPDYELGVVFGMGVPHRPWLPMQFLGEMFYGMQDGVLMYHDERDEQPSGYTGDNLPLSSGHPLSFQPAANGGYADTMFKTHIRDRYLQFFIDAHKLILR